jgi:hypothetical protein
VISDKDILNNLSYERDPQGILWCLPGTLFPDGRALKVLLPDNSRGHVHAFINAVRGEYLARETSKTAPAQSAANREIFDFDDLGNAEPEAQPASGTTAPTAEPEPGRFPDPRPRSQTGLSTDEAELEPFLLRRLDGLKRRLESAYAQLASAGNAVRSLENEIYTTETLIDTLNHSRGNKQPQVHVAAPVGDKPQPRRRGRPPKKDAGAPRSGDPESERPTG